jgi:hypothetical protein
MCGFYKQLRNWNQNLYFQRTRMGTRFMHGTKTETGTRTGTGIFGKKTFEEKTKTGRLARGYSPGYLETEPEVDLI